ncbi:MAG TPA: NAD-dependent epimerase/dehydratase family protein, partial [Azospirillum sp.]
AAAPAPVHAPAPAALAVLSNRAADALVIGGTGFIGRHVVSALCREGRRVAVMARRVDNLPAELAHPQVTVLRGDVQDEAATRRAVAGVSVVVNLAHGGGAETWPALERAIVGGARTVAEACLDAGTERLVHVSSIAALALGNRRDTVTGATPPDPRADRRDGYTRAKAEAERLLAEWHRTRGLPVVVLRPGVVIGRDGMPFHSGIGFYYREQHCLGWNRGVNPLPLVLVEDVADAVARAAVADGVLGKAYNLVGDVRLTAREYTAALAARQGRPLRFHPRALPLLYAEEVGKWVIKIAAGRRDAPFPAWGDLASRGMVARFDTADAKSDLGWRPVAVRERFTERAFPPVPTAAHAG